MRKWFVLVIGFAALATVAFSASCSLSVEGDGNGFGQLLIEPGGIVCDIDAGSASPDCFQDVAWAEQAFTLTASADPDNEFLGWTGDCDAISGTENEVCTVSFDGFDQHFVVTVTFQTTEICNVNSEGSDGPGTTGC